MSTVGESELSVYSSLLLFQNKKYKKKKKEMCQSHNYCCWVFLCWVIFFTWLYYNLIYLILFFKILKGNNCGSCFWTWQHYVLLFFFYYGSGQDTNRRERPGECHAGPRGATVYGVWFPTVLFLTAGFITLSHSKLLQGEA